jgi:SAM-dependent methyltransferase
MSEDPNQAEFWTQRYDRGRLPWDLGRVPAALSRFLANGPTPGAVLIPGCGSGHEIKAFAGAGWRVTALDFSPSAVARAQLNAGPALARCIVQGDFFTYPFPSASFDLIYERTFLCAVLPSRWPQAARRFAELLKPGGLLLGVFYIATKIGGPPFGLSSSEPARLFDPFFILEANYPVTDSLPFFAGHEFWQVRRRKPAIELSGGSANTKSKNYPAQWRWLARLAFKLRHSR